jgi:hypothetical protein
MNSTFRGILIKYSPFSSIHKFCPRLDPLDYEGYHDVIRYDHKGVRKMEVPILRIDSVSCPMWFQLLNSSLKKREAEAVLCCCCVKLKSQLDHQMRRTLSESPSKKLKRQDPSSKAPLSIMLPASQLKRKQNVKIRRDNTL